MKHPGNIAAADGQIGIVIGGNLNIASYVQLAFGERDRFAVQRSIEIDRISTVQGIGLHDRRTQRAMAVDVRRNAVAGIDIHGVIHAIDAEHCQKRSIFQRFEPQSTAEDVTT